MTILGIVAAAVRLQPAAVRLQPVGHHKFFDEVAHALAGAHEILLLGPAQTKQEFAGYLREKHAPLGRGIVAVENSDHPTDPEVLAYARRHFAAIDRMFSAETPVGALIAAAPDGLRRHVGLMLWFMRKRFVGSNLFFRATSRS